MDCVYYWQTPWIADNFCPKYWQVKRGVNRSGIVLGDGEFWAISDCEEMKEAGTGKSIYARTKMCITGLSWECMWCVCVCVCVWERERERERERFVCVCVCVCVRERERERERFVCVCACVCVCVCVCAYNNLYKQDFVLDENFN